MSRQNWTANNIHSALEQTMGRVFDDMYRRHGEPDESVVQSAWTPSADVREEDDGIAILVELPGIAKDEIDIALDSGVLTVSGERKLEKSEDRKGYHRVERAYGSFTRSFALHDGVDASGIEAGYKDGLLNLRVPKVKRPEAKSIEIKVA